MASNSKTNDKKLKYSYFPGCVGQTSTIELDRSMLQLADKLGIELVKMTEASCCGAGHLQDMNNELATVINARHLAYAEKEGLNLLTVCDTCQLHINEVNLKLKNDPEALAEVNKTLKEVGMEYKGTVEVKHILTALIEDYGLDRLKEQVVKPLDKYKIAPFYGCQILRPGAVSGLEDPDNPTFFEELIETLGGKTVDYESKTKCCGFHVELANPEAAAAMTGKALWQAKEKQADFMVTPCPLCHLNLDAQQEHSLHVAENPAKYKNVDHSPLPIMHVPQLVGLAVGLSYDQLSINKNIIRPEEIRREFALPVVKKK